MGMPFSADEVFEMAEEIERNGAKFYRAAAEKLPEVEKIFLKLAEMEDEHLVIFKTMRKELSGTALEQPVYDPDDEAQMYLQVMADGKVFNVQTDPAEQLSSVQTPLDALNVAIGAEKDSIAFYAGLKETVSKKAGKDKIDEIIKQELGHIAILKNKMDELN